MEQLDETPAHRALIGVLDGVLSDQMGANQHAARRSDGIRSAIDYARSHSYLYSSLPGDPGVHAADMAVRLEISVRLQLSEGHIGTLARVAEAAATHLPDLWRRAFEGFAPFTLVEAATNAIARLLPPADADEDARAAATEAIALVDSSTSEWVISLTPATFRRRLRILIDRLDPRDEAARHAQARAERRVVVEDAGDGMSWFMALMPTIEAIAAKRCLTSTAKHLQKDEREGRDRDQLRADLTSAWLRGERNLKPVKTKVFVTVPVGVLTGVSTDAEGRCTMCGGSGYPERARIVGADTLDPLTAKQLFLDAKAFHRVVFDPVRSVIVDLDRRRYRSTQAQRDWLFLLHGTCARDGCTRLAVESEIDHEQDWARGGPTNLDKLRPLCPPDHKRRHSTRLIYRSRPNRTVQVISPTGYASIEPPPF